MDQEDDEAGIIRFDRDKPTNARALKEATRSPRAGADLGRKAANTDLVWISSSGMIALISSGITLFIVLPLCVYYVPPPGLIFLVIECVLSSAFFFGFYKLCGVVQELKRQVEILKCKIR